MTLPPQPAIDPQSTSFWDALTTGELRLQYSPSVDRWQFPPLERCRFTGRSLEWRRAGHTGRIVSYIVQHRPAAAGFEDLLPYPIALIEPDGAPQIRVPMRIADSHGEGVAIGGRVTIAVEQHPGGDFYTPIARLIDG